MEIFFKYLLQWHYHGVVVSTVKHNVIPSQVYLLQSVVANNNKKNKLLFKEGCAIR
jgi:hypothetical protein